jgi:dolichyl-phosphate beta-glucosyltransferase
MMTAPPSAERPTPTLSVVIPTFNEARRIEQTLRSGDDYLRGLGIPYEVIVVDNASTDGSAALVADLIDRVLSSTRLVVQRSRGKGSAIKAGVLQSRGDYVVFMDADNATPVSELERVWPLWKSGCHVVIGSRYVSPILVAAPQTPIRIALSRIGNAVIQLLLLPGLRDTQLGFKGFTGEVARDLFGRITTGGWAFDVELLVMARRAGYRICEVSVLWREPGGSHLRSSAYFTTLVDVLKIRWRAWRGDYDRDVRT